MPEMCQDCRDVWGAEISDGVDAFLREWPDAEYGPAHVVLSDMNCEEHHIRWCLGLIAGEHRRRGVAFVLDHPDERRGADDLASGQLGSTDFYADCAGPELQATAAFLSDWLLPRTSVVESSGG